MLIDCPVHGYFLKLDPTANYYSVLTRKIIYVSKLLTLIFKIPPWATWNSGFLNFCEFQAIFFKKTKHHSSMPTSSREELPGLRAGGSRAADLWAARPGSGTSLGHQRQREPGKNQELVARACVGTCHPLRGHNNPGVEAFSRSGGG